MSIESKYENTHIIKFLEEEKTIQSRDCKIEFIKISNAKNISAFILIKQNYESMKVSKQRKKSKSHYCEVIFAGLRQPTKKINLDTYKVLFLFINRFKVNDMDICFDGENETPINQDNINIFYYLFNDYINSFKDCMIYKSSFYINTPMETKKDTNKFKRILIYDKYLKESRYKNLDENLKHWKRLEVTVNVEFKFNGFNLDDYLNDIERMAKKYFNSSNFSYEYLQLQKQLLTDRRTHRGKIL